MFLKKTVFATTLFFLISYPVFCQKIFRDSYIIKNDGSVLNGLVEYKNNQGNPSECIFKRFDIAVEMTYSPEEIKGFGYLNGNKYESKTLNGKTSFFEVLESGTITLYQSGSKYFLEKGKSGLIELSNGSIEYNVEGRNQKFEDLNSFLNHITEGKTDLIKDKINLSKDLIPIITAYNKGTGKSFIVYNQEYSDQLLINDAFRSGVGRNKFGFFAGINIYSLNIKPLENYFVPAPEPETAPTFGITFERILSRKNDQFAFRADLLILKQNFYSYSESEYSVYDYKDDVFFEFTGVKLPLMLQYSFLSGRIVPYMNAGVTYMIVGKTMYLHTREAETANHEIFTTEDSNFPLNSGEFTGLFGAGIKMKAINSINLSFEGRMEIGMGILNEKEDINFYKEYSVQPTILMRITF